MRINRRTVQLTHQSREVSDGARNYQRNQAVPEHKTLSAVRSNSTRWGNEKAQVCAQGNEKLRGMPT